MPPTGGKNSEVWLRDALNVADAKHRMLFASICPGKIQNTFLGRDVNMQFGKDVASETQGMNTQAPVVSGCSSSFYSNSTRVASVDSVGRYYPVAKKDAAAPQ
jgi:hypothetical protein